MQKINLIDSLNSNSMLYPLFGHKVAAGFPSPADDHLESKLDLNKYLINNPAATFFVRVEGDSMINAGIFQDDLLIVDKSLKATSGKIIIAVLNGELTLKRLYIKNDKIILIPENSKYKPIPINSEADFHIWGVVTSVIHKL